NSDIYREVLMMRQRGKLCTLHSNFHIEWSMEFKSNRGRNTDKHSCYTQLLSNIYKILLTHSVPAGANKPRLYSAPKYCVGLVCLGDRRWHIHKVKDISFSATKRCLFYQNMRVTVTVHQMVIHLTNVIVLLFLREYYYNLSLINVLVTVITNFNKDTVLNLNLGSLQVEATPPNLQINYGVLRILTDNAISKKCLPKPDLNLRPLVLQTCILTTCATQAPYS
ncbi:hypothetical protein L9F63_018093, partial [Diploptera punctata]